jgi:nucleoside-diphosphate-sugar epimerase
MKLLILGGTRFVGIHVARAFVEAGADVTLLHRGVTTTSIPGARFVIGDRSRPDGLAGLGSERFDAVLDMSAYFADWTRAAAEVLAGRVAHYVFVSSGAVYRPSAELPWPETTPFGPMPIWGRYGEEKIASERLLWEAHASGRFAVTAFRLPFILGPGNFADRESFVFSRLEAGRPILLPGGGTALNQFVYAEDVARALVAALERPGRSGGEAYNCTHPSAITNRGWAELCADVAGWEPWLVPIDDHALGVASETVDLTNILFPFPALHYVLDGSKLTRDLGIEMTTGNRRMLEEYWSWWQQKPDRAPKRYEREVQAVATLKLDRSGARPD